jgi:hypothetical protein
VPNAPPFVYAPIKGHLANVSLEIVRELDLDDVQALRSREIRPHYAPPPVRVLSARHRYQARLLAAGKGVPEVAELTGVSNALIHGLQKDQSFIDLIATYEAQITDGYVDDEKRIYEKLLVVGETALDEMQSQLDGQSPTTKVPYGELRKTVELAADRTVAPPKSTDSRHTAPAFVTLNFGRTLTPREIVDVSPSPALPAPATPETDQ